MEALIELIFGNFLILGLIVGGLISLFGRIFSGNNESGDRERDRNHRNDTGQDPGETSGETPGSRTSGPVSEAESETGPPASPSQSGNGYEQQMEELRKKQKRARELTSKAGRSSMPLSESPVSGENQGTASGIAPITPESAKQGVLWAEILGPPVSKRNRQRGTSHGTRR